MRDPHAPRHPRRNPPSANRRRRGGPLPPPSEIRDPALRTAMTAWVARFRERRGCPAWVSPVFIGVLRRQGAWYEAAYDIPRPDGGPRELP